MYCMYIYIYIYIPALGKFSSQDFDVLPRGFCAESSPPQISATLIGHFSGK